MKRILAGIGRVLRAVAHGIAETIRFGAIPSAAAPRGGPGAQSSDLSANVAGLSREDDRSERDNNY